MSGDWDEDVCKRAMVLVAELCFNSPRGYSQSERCQEFSYLLRGRNRQLDTGEDTPPPSPDAGSNPGRGSLLRVQRGVKY